MRLYELVLILRPSLKDADRKKLIETIKSWLEKAKITKEGDLGQKPLAYPISHESAGYYYQMIIESAEGMTKDFEERIIRQDNIIRHLVLRTK